MGGKGVGGPEGCGADPGDGARMQPRQSRFGGQAARRILKAPFIWRSPDLP
jgi:hypothetical protein